MKKSPWLNFGLPIAFFLLAGYGMPISAVFQFDPNDEGIELIKAVLHLKGFALYTQIYNDQPPLFTIVLSSWLRFFGQSIVAARLLTLSFATLLVWAFCQTLRLYLGNLLALIGTILLIISCNFLRLSVSVMVGLPALALAMLAIYAVTVYKQYSSRFALIASGVLLALSLQTKLFTALIILVIIFDIVQFRLTLPLHQRSHRILMIDLAIWLAALLAVFLLVGVWCHSLSYDQLVSSHFAPHVKTAFDAASSYQLIGAFLLQDFDYLLLATLATIALWQTQCWQQLLPLVWLLAAFLLLLLHRPVWYHHYLLISLPLTWLATSGVTLSFEVLQQWRRSPFGRGASRQARLAALCVLFLMLLVPIKLGATQLENQRILGQSPDYRQLVAALLPQQRSPQWLFTDCPMAAFYAGLLVPPEIAVLPFIRIESNAITPAQLLAVLEKYHPEQTLLCKSSLLRQAVQDYLQQHYAKTYENNVGSVYRLKF